MTIGMAYVSASLLLLTNTERARTFAIYTWYPMFLASPWLARKAISAIDGTLGSVANLRNQKTAWTLDEVIEKVSELAIQTFSIRHEELNKDLIEDLRIGPGEIDRFLDDLDIDYGFPVSSEDRKKVSTTEDIISLITGRMKKISNQTDHTTAVSAPR
ncbi:hypothetical protein [Pelagicoccus albus]|uniref:Uncharacterized protein n=1 Tax=Pelagicoccus albus TaxID=415222 RepID=A0A7X1E6L5_9BACT|nr:hypothetical protein [Pelagicoccus albus]MBC2604820.1 hypothetical protein [Pelagicoccus albus]